MAKKQAAPMVAPASLPAVTSFKIVVLDRGFVYVGNVSWDGDMLVITAARNIRRWGTTQGLGELARLGPRPNTVLDDVGTVRAPARALISLIDTEDSLWARPAAK
jgi:hypothetical protein